MLLFEFVNFYMSIWVDGRLSNDFETTCRLLEITTECIQRKNFLPPLLNNFPAAADSTVLFQNYH